MDKVYWVYNGVLCTKQDVIEALDKALSPSTTPRADSFRCAMTLLLITVFHP